MNIKILSTYLLVSLALSACSAKPADVGGQYSRDENSTEQQLEKPSSKYLAYRHTLRVELDKEDLVPTHQEIVTSCQNDTQHQCAVLSSNFNAGVNHSSHIKLRLKSSGVKYFSNLASKGGEIASQGSTAEDLRDSIVETNKRISMLESYREKLQSLEAKPNGDIDALIKIASELSQVQNDIEYAKGRSAKLLQRVELDILDIALFSHRESSFTGPIVDALSEFINELSYGIADVISSAAFIIPWLIFIILLFLVIRSIFRFFKR